MLLKEGCRICSCNLQLSFHAIMMYSKYRVESPKSRRSFNIGVRGKILYSFGQAPKRDQKILKRRRSVSLGARKNRNEKKGHVSRGPRKRRESVARSPSGVRAAAQPAARAKNRAHSRQPGKVRKSSRSALRAASGLGLLGTKRANV